MGGPSGHRAAQLDLARKVKAARIQRLMTQQELAEKAGMGRATVARIEVGGVTPRMRTVKDLAKALQVEPTDLVQSSLWARGSDGG